MDIREEYASDDDSSSSSMFIIGDRDVFQL